MITENSKKYVSRLSLMDLYGVYTRIDKENFFDDFQYVRSKLKEHTNENLDDIPDYSVFKKDDLISQLESLDKSQNPIKTNLISQALKKASVIEEKKRRNPNYNFDNETIFTEKAIVIATSIGGPIAAGIMFSNNYKILGRFDAARTSLLLGFGVLALILVFLIFGPQEILELIPIELIPGIYTFITYLLVKETQLYEIEEFLKSGGEKAKFSKIIGIAFLSIVLSMGIFFGFSLFAPTYDVM